MKSTVASATDRAPRTLGRWSRRILGALADVVTPRAADAPVLPASQIVDFIDDWVRYMPRLFRVLFPVGLLLLELGAFVLGPSLLPFSLMSRERQRRYVDEWVHASWQMQRDLIKGVKGLCLLAYYSDRRVLQLLGYTVEEHVQTVKAERLRRYGHEL